jgi:hypothetical protein
MKGQRVDVTHALSKLRSGQATQFNIGTIPYEPWTETQLNLR